MGNIDAKPLLDARDFDKDRRKLVILDLIVLFLCFVIVVQLFSIVPPDLQLVNDCKMDITDADNCKYAGLATIIATYAAIIPGVILVVLLVFMIRKRNSIGQAYQISTAINFMTILSIVVCVLTLAFLLILGILALVSFFG